MDAKHTKGPWFLSDLCSDLEIYIPYKDSVVPICLVEGCRGDPRDEANARLLTEAPNLLKACKAAEAVLSDYQLWHDDGTRCEDIETATRKTLRDAIAETEGT